MASTTGIPLLHASTSQIADLIAGPMEHHQHDGGQIRRQ
jgi:hypothetical protein